MVVALALALPCFAQRAEVFASGLNKPVDFQADPTSKDRFYVVEQSGSIRVIEKGKLLEKPFLTIPADRFTDKGWEQGLLGLAFDPEFAKNKRFYVNYINKKGDTHISRFTATDAATADAASELIILEIDQPYSNHNGGCLRFGPDKMLYIGMGDGGAAGDPQNRAQNLKSLLGKMLRIDVSTAPPEGKTYVVPKDNPFVGREDALPEIWAYGLRNPWRFEFDSKGRIWIGDVGQDKYEWIHMQPADSKGGENYGWNIMEGDQPFKPRRRKPEEQPTDGKQEDKAEAPAPKLVPPLYTYKHIPGAGITGGSITGGFFYEGKKVPNFTGRYIFAEFMAGKVWSLEITSNGKAFNLFDHSPALAPGYGKSDLTLSPSSFGRDHDGELYLCDLKGGRILKLVP